MPRVANESNEGMVTNEIIINGEVQLSTRNNTVTEETLVQNETAQTKAGKSIQGKLDPVNKSEAYMVSDEVGDIDDNDYIPFNDVSDSVKPKKKTLFSNIIDKVKSAIGKVYKLSSNGINDEQIPANADLNDFAYMNAGTYYCNQENAATLLHCPVDHAFKLSVDTLNMGVRQTITIVDLWDSRVDEENIYTRIYNHGTQISWWTDWEVISYKNENLKYDKATMLVGTDDLDDIHSAGTYHWIYSESETGWNPTNIPENSDGFMFHIYSGRNNGHPQYRQIVLNPNNNKIFERTYNGTSWGTWVDLTEGGGGEGTVNGYATGVVSGSAITATITGFQLKAGVIVSIESGMPENATLNINDTGAKTIVWRYANPISKGDTVYDRHSIYTYMYDGTYYRIIANHFSPIISVNNYVANTSGKLELNFGYNSDKSQLIHDISAERLAHKFYKNASWSADKYLAYQQEIVVNKGVEIPNNSDFNTYQTEGIYYISADANAQTMTNIPEQRAGKLIVFSIFGGVNYRVQIYMTYEGKVYKRRYISTATTVWSTWEEFATGGVGSEAVLWEQENILGAKNLFFNNAPSSFEKSGIVFTTRSDGGVRVNGTATADMWVSLYPWDGGNAITQTFDFGDYWLSGCPSNGSSNTYALYVQERNNADDGNAHSYGDYGGGCSVKIDTTGKIRAFIFVKSGTTLDKIFYPMIRLANIKNSTFVQPSWKNKDISQKLIAPLGKNILANANLNSFIEEGSYTIAYDATAATLTNRPCNYAGKLVVLKGRKNANLLQFYMRYDRNAGIYERTSDDGGSTWTSWGEYAMNGERNYNLNGLEVKQFSKPDNSGYPCYLLIADITTWYNSTTTGQARIAFEGILISTRDGYMADHLVHIGLGVSYQKTTSADNGKLILKSTSTIYRPYIITDGTKYYLSIGITGSGRTFRMFGRWENVSLINTWVNTTDSNGTLPSGWSIAINNNNHQWDETILGQGVPYALGMGYAYCSTAQNTLAKVASATGYIPKYGGIIAVYFANSVLANSTLSINEKTAYAIKYRGSAIGNYIIRSGDRVLMLYSDSAYHVIAIDRPRSVVTSRGSAITVTADGNKTVATLLQELRAKLITTIQNEGENRAFRLNFLGAPWGIYMHIASPQWVYNSTADSVTIQASGSRATSDGYLRTGAISVTGSASSPTVKFYYNNKNASTDTFIDVTNNKPSNGDTFTISYDRYDYI